MTSSSASLRSLAPMSIHTSVNCGTLLRSSLVIRCGARRAMTPGSRTVPRPHGQVLAEQNLHVPAADGLDVKEAIVVDVLHHEADLIAVAGEHDARRPFSLLPAAVRDRMTDGKHIAVTVGAHFIGVVGGPGADHILYGTFVSGGTGRFEEFLKKSVRRLVHGREALLFSSR